eukprot:TRINITY_DN2965_c0_g1_i2.p1 TRINITY_DN2965_c0_g1~~TRINITY_DN2965_c0_g1_i2.p1  ORF type:complete len:153 (+),score=16.78 TRINITY_DN2965_c0_g1_i2:122-580(+)
MNNYIEAHLLRTFSHINIVQFVDCWKVKDELWIMTEFLEGGTLYEALSLIVFSENHAAHFCKQILSALKYLHEIHYCHRDIKSSNIVLSLEGHVKLIDFGLCADVSQGGRLQMLGSPFWIAPEMILRQPHAEPADIWSFGICTLEIFLVRKY